MMRKIFCTHMYYYYIKTVAPDLKCKIIKSKKKKKNDARKNTKCDAISITNNAVQRRVVDGRNLVFRRRGSA